MNSWSVQDSCREEDITGFPLVEGRCKEGKAIQFSVAHLEFREETFPFSEKGDMFSYFAVGIDDRSGVE